MAIIRLRQVITIVLAERFHGSYAVCLSSFERYYLFNRLGLLLICQGILASIVVEANKGATNGTSVGFLVTVISILIKGLRFI